MLLLCALIAGVGSAWGDDTTVSVSISSYATANNWSNGTAYSSVTIDTNISASGNTGGDNNKYYSSNTSWRHYEAGSGAITITATGGCTLKSITFTYASGNTGVLKYNSSNVTTETACTAVNGQTSATFSVGHSSGTKNGNVQITKISVTYTPSSSSSTCADPTFSPAAGAVAYGTAIAISSTEGATIRYTTDGTTPTKSVGTVYDSSSKPTITAAATTIKAIAYDGNGDLKDSKVASAAYTIQAPDAPVFSIKGGTVTKGATVSLSSGAGTTIRYTTDGTTMPTASVGTVYSEPIAINANQTIKAVAYDGGGNCSAVASYAFTAFEGTVVTFNASSDTGSNSSGSGSITKAPVTFSCSSSNLSDGTAYRLYSSSTTTISSTNGKISRIEFTKNGTYALSNLSASGYSDGVWSGSAASVSFSASAQVRVEKIVVFVNTTATPTFSVAEGKYSEAKSVTISCATDGASIYYTMDGSTPTSSSTAYSSAIAITESTTLKAIAIKDGVESDVASATYTMNRPEAPTFDVAEGTFASAFTLHLATATDGATIYYTTDGTTPTSSNSAYTTGIDIPAASTTVKAVAVKNGLTSDVATAAYTYDTRPAPSFTLSATSIDLKVKETSSAVTLTTNSDGAVTFACADAHITLTGTGNSRTIKADAAGIYTVTVSTAATSNYLAGNGTITVNVTKKATTMDLVTSFTSKDLYVTTSGSVTGTVKYGDDKIDGAEVTYSSSDETVATIAADGAITYKKAGSTTITASYAGDDEYAACEETYTLVLYDTTPQATQVAITLNNTFFGCTAFTGWTTGMATTLSGTNKKIEITYGKGSSANMYCNSEKVRFYTNNTFTVTAPSGYHITKVVFNASISSADPTGSVSTTTWTGSASSVSFTFANKTDLTYVTVTLAPAVTITTAKYATYCSPHKLDFSETGITVYKAKVNGSVVKMTEISNGIVPANTGVILYKNVDAVTTIAVPVTTTDATITDNELVGTTVRTLVKKEADSKFNYILQKSGSSIVFNMATTDGAYMPANRAYLSTAYNASAGSARLSVVFEDEETTGIHTVNSGKYAMNGVVYDLQGRRVENPRKGGLYIVNGRKVVKN